MQTALYLIYGIAVVLFVIFAGFAIHHALRYQYISPRIVIITLIFVVVSLILLGISFYFLLNLNV